MLTRARPKQASDGFFVLSCQLCRKRGFSTLSWQSRSCRWFLLSGFSFAQMAGSWATQGAFCS